MNKTMTERDYSKLDGGKWVKLLLRDPSKAALCDWKRLTGAEWRVLLKKHPEFAAKCGEFGGWGMMNAHDWHRLLVDQPQFYVHCDLGRLEREGLLEGVLKCRPELGDKVDKNGWSTEKWLWILSLCPNNAELARQCDKWDEFPVDRACDLMCDHPGLLRTCPDKVLRKFRLGHWAKLYRCAAPIPYVVDKRPHGLNDMTCVVADKMRDLGVAAEVDARQWQGGVDRGLRMVLSAPLGKGLWNGLPPLQGIHAARDEDQIHSREFLDESPSRRRYTLSFGNLGTHSVAEGACRGLRGDGG